MCMISSASNGVSNMANKIQDHGEVFLFEIVNKTLYEQKEAKGYTFEALAKIIQCYDYEQDDKNLMIRISDEISKTWVSCDFSKAKLNFDNISTKQEFMHNLDELKKQDLYFKVGYAYNGDEPIFILREINKIQKQLGGNSNE